MMFQMQNFINTLNDICEFTFIEGPKNVTRYPPVQYFVDKGIVPPYKRWLEAKYKSYRILQDGTRVYTALKTEVNFNDGVETILYILQFLNM